MKMQAARRDFTAAGEPDLILVAGEATQIPEVY